MMNSDYSIRETVGIFDSFEKMQSAINELEMSGFDRRQVSVLGSEAAIKDRFGHTDVEPETLEHHPDTPRSPTIRREELGLAQGALVSGGVLTGVVTAVIASGGIAVPGLTLTAILGGAGGGAAGGILASLLGEQYASFFESQIENGGLLLWVQTPDDDAVARARVILARHDARDIEVHELSDQNLGKIQFTCSPNLVDASLLQLERIFDVHERLIDNDAMLRTKLDLLQDSLKSARQRNEIGQDLAREVSVKISHAAAYAKDMAEEEQRMISESPAEGVGKMETELVRYFEIASDLNSLRSDFLRHVIEDIAA